LIPVIKSSNQFIDRQAYGSVVIHAASALIIINNYETITLAAVTIRDDGDRCLAPEARRHTIGRCHVAQHVGNCVFWRPEKILYFMTRVQVGPWTFRSRFCRKFCDLYAIYTV